MKTIQLFREFESQLLADEVITPVVYPQLPARWWTLYAESLCLSTLILLYVPSVPLSLWLHVPLSILLSALLFIPLVQLLKRHPHTWLTVGIRIASLLLTLQILLPLLMAATLLLGHALGCTWADIYYDRLLTFFQK